MTSATAVPMLAHCSCGHDRYQHNPDSIGGRCGVRPWCPCTGFGELAPAPEMEDPAPAVAENRVVYPDTVPEPETPAATEPERHPCSSCPGRFTLTRAGLLRAHKHNGERCAGAGQLPTGAVEPEASMVGLGTPPEFDPGCDRCNYDRHRCPGCGTPVRHGTVVCVECNADESTVDDQETDSGRPESERPDDADQPEPAPQPSIVVTERDGPVRPWFTGTRTLNGVAVTMGAEHVGPALADLLRTGQPLAVDLENEGLAPPASERLHCVGIGTADRVVIVDPRDARQRDMLRMATDAAPALVFHNSAFDVPILARAGCLGPSAVWKILDTVIYARLAYPERTTSRKLEALAHKLLGRPKPGSDPLATAAKAEKLTKSAMYQRYDIDRPLYVEGNAADVAATASLLPVIRKAALDRLTTGHPYTEYGTTGDEALRLLDREQVDNRVMLARSVKGLAVDLDFADAFADRFDSALASAAQLLAGYGITAGDSASLVRWLDAQGLIPGPDLHPRLQNGSPSGEKKYLERLAHPLAKMFVLHKEQDKIQRDYITKMRDLSVNGRIHPQVAILGATATGRMSMGSPPLQQFPAGARGMILADDGDALSSTDWSQIEPVTAGYLAHDTQLLAGYEAGHEKVYDTIARLAGITYKQGKTTILAGMYGQGLPLLASNLGVDPAEAKRIRTAAESAYPIMIQHFDRIKQAAKHHLLVPTVSGRMLPVPRQLDEETGEWRVATHMAVNYHVQGSAYDVLAEAIYTAHQHGLSEHIYLAMHDELVTSTAVAEEFGRIMRTPPPALVARAGRMPVLRTERADLGQRWAYV